MSVHTYARNRGSRLPATSQKTLLVECAWLLSQNHASGTTKGSNETEVPPMTIVPPSLQSNFHFNVTRYVAGISFHLTGDLHVTDCVFYANILHVQQVIYRAQPNGKLTHRSDFREAVADYSATVRARTKLNLVHSHCKHDLTDNSSWGRCSHD